MTQPTPNFGPLPHNLFAALNKDPAYFGVTMGACEADRVDNRQRRDYRVSVPFRVTYLRPVDNMTDSPLTKAWHAGFNTETVCACMGVALKKVGAQYSDLTVSLGTRRFSRVSFDPVTWARPAAQELVPEGTALWQLRFDVDFVAKKPSLLRALDEEYAAAVDNAGLENLIEDLARLVSLHAQAHEERHRIMDEANGLLRTLAEEAQEKAMKVVRYEQRLAALRAELEAETSVQATTLFAAWDKEGWTEEEDDAYHPRSLALARQNAASVGKGSARTLSRRFGTHRLPWWLSLEDID